ncbi:hypothetical protein [Bradyrhizobium sp. SZCCHNPS2010]|uniref:hypothetical protein n=1 Tax=Bradyrhizobium sp. SZCCHNPS2010 TaxID=3057333 RepID=UPI00291613E3|nr:hypothetical protein [Bradyrhizobium sp. SZCCHNPS2010]
MNIDDIEIGSPGHALALASCLDGQEEVVLGPSDIELCVKALRNHARDGRPRAIRKISADGPITVDLLERCLDRLALAMHRAPQGGDVYLPLWDRLEQEIEARRANESTMARALRRLE